MLERNSVSGKRIGRILRDGNVFDLLAIAGSGAEVSDCIRGGEPARDGERREEPSRLSQKIVEGDGMSNPVRAGPLPARRRGRKVLDFGGRAGRKREIGAG